VQLHPFNPIVSVDLSSTALALLSASVATNLPASPSRLEQLGSQAAIHLTTPPNAANTKVGPLYQPPTVRKQPNANLRQRAELWAMCHVFKTPDEQFPLCLANIVDDDKLRDVHSSVHLYAFLVAQQLLPDGITVPACLRWLCSRTLAQVQGYGCAIAKTQRSCSRHERFKCVLLEMRCSLKMHQRLPTQM
jgi:hypothetical protein